MATNTEYQNEYEDRLTAEQDTIVDAYYEGYRRGHRDARKEYNTFGWYNGILIGTIGTLIGGWILHISGNQHKSVDISFGKH